MPYIISAKIGSSTKRHKVNTKAEAEKIKRQLIKSGLFSKSSVKITKARKG